jgi:hypothetical protein
VDSFVILDEDSFVRCLEDYPQSLLALFQPLLYTLALGNVADVALNDVMPVFPIDITGELYIPLLSRFGLKRHIFVMDIARRLQLSKHSLAHILFLEQADFPEFLS